jgi:aryl-alcohol dehydrogenase-like predicted oxidoreductase
MLTRREFLKKTMRGLTALAVSDSVTTQSSAIPMRTLGKTGLKLPILGFGGAVLASYWGNPLSYEERVALVRYAYDRGVRYFDTAGNYGESQSILGEALKDRRKDVCLVTKVETTKPEEVRRAVEKSLKELQTDYLDILLIHGTPGLEQMSAEQVIKIHAELVKLRDEKITRFIGFSAHDYFDKGSCFDQLRRI